MADAPAGDRTGDNITDAGGPRRPLPATPPTPASTLKAMVHEWQHRVGNQAMVTLAATGVGAGTATGVGAGTGPGRAPSAAATAPSPKPPPRSTRSSTASPSAPAAMPTQTAVADAVTGASPIVAEATAPPKLADAHPKPAHDDLDLIEIEPAEPTVAHRQARPARPRAAAAQPHGRSAGTPTKRHHDFTTPGFTERNAAARAAVANKPKGRGSNGGVVAGPASADAAPTRSPKGALRERSTAARHPSIGDPDLDRWRSGLRAGLATLHAGPLDNSHAEAAAIDQHANELAGQRVAPAVDPVVEAKGRQPAIPQEAPVEQHLDTSGPEAVIAAIARAGTRRLVDQEFTDIGSPPEYTGATLTHDDYIPKLLTDDAARLEAELRTAHDGSTFTDLTTRLAAVKQRIAAIDVPSAAGLPAYVPRTLTDDGPDESLTLNADLSEVLGDALARARLLVPATTSDVINQVVATVHGQNIARIGTFADQARVRLEGDLTTELNAISAAAGVSQHQLEVKVIEQEVAVVRLTAANQAAIDEASTRAVNKREELAKHEAEVTAGAAESVRQEVAAKQAAVHGALPMSAVEQTREDLLRKLRSAGAASLTNLKAAMEKRNAALDAGAQEKKQAIRRVAGAQAAAIRRHWADDPDKAMVEARPTADWGIAQVARVDRELHDMKALVASEEGRYESELIAQLEPGTEQVRDWAAQQMGRERSEWERTVDMLDDWARLADSVAAAWEAHRQAESRDAAAQDFTTLVKLRQSLKDRNRADYDAAMRALSAEQQQLVDSYLRGGVDSIGFVAESMMVRLARRYSPALVEEMERRAIAELDWTELLLMARQANPEFQPVELANKVRRGVHGAGTRDVQLWSGLEGARTAIERAALTKCYQATFGQSMYTDIDEDTTGAEWNRAKALMAGDTARAEAAKIAHAMSPTWVQGSFIGKLATDDGTIRETLRGKSPEELEAIGAAYAEDYEGSILGNLRGNLSDAKYDNAFELLAGDTERADAAELEDAMRGPGTAEQKMFRVYERIREEEGRYALQHGLTKVELDNRIVEHNKRIALLYSTMGYGDLTANATDELRDSNPANRDVDLVRFTALQGGDAAEIDAAEAMGEREGLYTSDEGVERIVRTQRKRAEFEFELRDAAARTRLETLHASGDIDLSDYVRAMSNLDLATQDKRDERERDIKDLGRKKVGALSAAYERMANGGPFAELHATADGHETFARLVDEGTSYSSKDKINLLVERGGALEEAEELHYATAGLRPDESRIDETLFGKNPTQIARLKESYEGFYGAGSFAKVLDSLSGRAELDTKLTVQYGHPSTFVAQLSDAKPADRAKLIAGFQDYLERRRSFEASSSAAAIGGALNRQDATAPPQPLDDSGMEIVAQIARAVEYAKAYDKALTAAEQAGVDPTKKMSDPAVLAARTKFDAMFQGAMQAQTEVRDEKDAFADTAAMVAAAVVGLVVTIASAGTLATPTATALAAMYGAIASTAVSIATKNALKGNAYTWRDIGTDVAVGVVDAAMNFAVPYIGGRIAARLRERVAEVVAEQVAKHAGEAVSEGAIHAFVKETLMEGLTNGITAMPSAFTAGVLAGQDFDAAIETAEEGGLEGAKFGMAIHAGKTGGGALIKGGRVAVRGVKRLAGFDQERSLTGDAVGQRLSRREISRRSNVPSKYLKEIGKVADKHDHYIDVAPMSVHAGKLLGKGKALPRHRFLLASEINEIDLVLGLGNPTSLGKIGYFRPEQIHVPEHIDLLPKEVRDAIIARIHQRISDYASGHIMIEYWAGEGKIRIDPDGVIINTGLAGPKEQPFTADVEIFDIRQRDNRQVDQEKDNEKHNVLGRVMDDLRERKTGVTRDPFSDEDAAVDAELAKHTRELRQIKYSEGGDEALVRTGGGKARAVFHEPYAVSEGSASYFEGPAGMNEALNRANFRKHIRAEPTSEFGLLRDRKTGRYIVIQGNATSVRPALAAKIDPDGDWVSIAHSHPVDKNGKTSTAGRVPSGSRGDFAAVAGASMKANFTSVHEEIHFLMDDGKTIGVTKFGVEPAKDEMYFIEVPLEKGKSLTKRFKSMDAYHKWVRREFGISADSSSRFSPEFERYVSAARQHGWLPVSPVAPERLPGSERLTGDGAQSPTTGRAARPTTTRQMHAVKDPAASSRFGITADDVGKPLRGSDLTGVSGYSTADITTLQDVCAAHGVLIDMVPTSPHAAALVRDFQALRLPESLSGLAAIDDLDVMLGLATSANLGKVGLFHPDRIVFPPAGFDQLEPRLQDQLRSKVADRRAEFAAHAGQVSLLSDTGQIRVEPSGVLVNISLQGRTELPFTTDPQVFDIRQSDGRPVEWDVYRQVMNDLRSRMRVSERSISHTRIDPSDPVARRRFAERRGRSEEGGDRPVVSFGGSEPKVAWHQPYEIPEGSTFHLEGAPARDRRANYRHFTEMMALEPHSEFALMYNETTGEYLVMQGNGSNVPSHLAAQMAPGGVWVMLAHSHPVEVGHTSTIAANRVPSGSRGDFGTARDEVLRTGRRFESDIYFTKADGTLGITRFGIDPTLRDPYFIAVDGEEPRHFRNVEEYHTWFRTEHHGDLGPVRPIHQQLDDAMARRYNNRQHPRPGRAGSRVEAGASPTTSDGPGRVASNGGGPKLPPDQEHSGFHELVPADHGRAEPDARPSGAEGDAHGGTHVGEEPTNPGHRARPRPAVPERELPGGGPRPEDVGRTLKTNDLQRRYHISEPDADAINRVCADQEIIADILPMSAEADQLLASGAALPRHYLIALSPLDRLDLMLGIGSEANIGKVVYYTPDQLKLPADLADLDPATQHQLQDRLADRHAEFADGHEKIAELIADGRIRVDDKAGNVILNINLAGSRQLPFTEDLRIFDIRHRNNQALTRDEYAAAVSALWDACPRIKAGSFESARFDSDVAQSTDRLDRGRRRYAEGGLVRFGEAADGTVTGAARRRYAIGPGSLYDFETPETRGLLPALGHFKTLIQLDRLTEVALMYNRTTGQYVVVQGSQGEVLISAVRAAGEGDWVLLAHNHPIDPGLGHTPVTQRVPSGAEADMKEMTRIGKAANRRVQSLLYFTDETGKLAATRFGYDPHHTEPYFIKVPETRDHPPVSKRFKGLDEYQVWLNARVREARPTLGARSGARGDEPTAPGKRVPADHGSTPTSVKKFPDEPDKGPGRVSSVRGTDPPVKAPVIVEDPEEGVYIGPPPVGPKPRHFETDDEPTHIVPIETDGERTGVKPLLEPDGERTEVKPLLEPDGERTEVKPLLEPDDDRTGVHQRFDTDNEITGVHRVPDPRPAAQQTLVEPPGPTTLDIGRNLDYADLADRYGLTAKHVDEIRRIAATYGVIIDIVPTNVYSERLVAAGAAIVSPAQLGIRALDDLDLLLGIGSKQHRGKIVYAGENGVKLPDNFDSLDPALQERLTRRAKQRNAEIQESLLRIAELVSSGKIRIEEDGLIINTGLSESGELPFAASNKVFDIRQIDGRPLEAPVPGKAENADFKQYREVMNELLTSDTGITEGAFEYSWNDSPGTFDKEAFTERQREHEPGGVPLVRLGAELPNAVFFKDYAIPEGSTWSLGGARSLDRRANFDHFHEHMRADPTAEYGLLRNERTGQYVVMQGNIKMVPTNLAAEVGGEGPWVVVAHSHPNRGGMRHVEASNQVPSGAKADMGFVTFEAFRLGTRAESEIHWFKENGEIGVTKFGMDPHDNDFPYFVEVEGLPPERFANIDKYHEWYRRVHRGDLGEVPRRFRGPRDAAHTTEPAVPPTVGDKPASSHAATDDDGPTTPKPIEGGADPAAPDRDWGGGDTEPHGRRFDPDQEPTAPHPVVPATEAAGPVAGAGQRREFGPGREEALHPVRIGVPITDDSITSEWGIPHFQALMIKAVAARHGVLIRMGRTPAVAQQLMANMSALARPPELDLWPIEPIDVRLGMARSVHLGKLALVDPALLRLPDDFADLDPHTQEALQARMLLRRNEYARFSADVIAFADADRIRINGEGILFNTGLAPGGELPFTLDHEVFDIVGLDGNPLPTSRFNRVVDELISRDIGITRGHRTRALDAEAPRADDPFAAMADPPADPQRRRTLQLDRDEQQVVDVPPQPLSVVEVDLPGRPEPADGPANREYFRRLVIDSPTVEFALMLNVETNEYFVIKGTTEAVSQTLGVMRALSRMRPGGRFVMEAHSHPVARELGFAPNINRIPSGGAGDFLQVAIETFRSGESFHNEIYYINEHNRLAVTHYGIDPDADEPYYIDFARTGEQPESHRFASIEAYHEFIRTEFGGEPTPIDPDFPRTPTEWRALEAAGHQPPAGGRPAGGGGAGAGGELAVISKEQIEPAHAAASRSDQEDAERRRRRQQAVPEADVLVKDRLAARTPLGDRKDSTGFKEGVRTAKDGFARLAAPPSFGSPGYSANPYEDTHAQRQAASNHWTVPLAAQRILCRQCWQWFRDFAKEEEADQYVADPSGVHVFAADGSYWLEPHPFGGH